MRRNDEYDERERNISPYGMEGWRGENEESRKEEDMKKEGDRESEEEREGTVAGG